MSTKNPRWKGWRKASASSNENDCVEVFESVDAVRDSQDPDGPVVRGNVPALVAAIKTGVIA